MDVKGLSGAEAFLGLLGKMGIEYIFASPGSEWAPVWEYLAKPYSPGEAIPQYLSSRHEEMSVGVNTPALMPATIQRACQLAMSIPRGPVFVSLPMEYLFATMATSAPAAASLPHCPTADPRGIEELARMLAEAKNPVIIPEELGRTVGAVERLVELAELLGAPVVETRDPGYVNFPRTHPLHGGNDPGPYLQDADLVLLLNAVRPWHP